MPNIFLKMLEALSKPGPKAARDASALVGVKKGSPPQTNLPLAKRPEPGPEDAYRS